MSKNKDNKKGAQAAAQSTKKDNTVKGKAVENKVKEQEKDYSGLERIGIFAFGSALFLGAAVLFV